MLFKFNQFEKSLENIAYFWGYNMKERDKQVKGILLY